MKILKVYMLMQSLILLGVCGVNDDKYLDAALISEDSNKPVIEIIDTTLEVDESTIEYVAYTNDEYTGGANEYLLSVDTLNNTVNVYIKNSTTNEFTTLVKTMDCSCGRGTEEDGNITLLGEFKTSDYYEWRQLFGNVFGQYAVRFSGSILFHSVPYLTQDKSSLETIEYNKLGELASAGCTRMAVRDVKWIYDNCPTNTIVQVNSGKNKERLYTYDTYNIDECCEYGGWDPTDPDEENPWIGNLPTFDGLSNIRIKVDSEFSYSNEQLSKGVTAYDYDGEELPIEVNARDLHTNEVGDYYITYSVTSKLGITVTKYIRVSVVEEL